MKKFVALIIITVEIIVALSSCFFGNKQQNQVVDGKMYSMSITNIDHDVIDPNSGEKGMRVNVKVILASGKHSYSTQFWIFDENGNMVNLENNVELKADLGEWNIKDNSYNENEGDFFIPYFILPNNKGRTNYIIAGRLDRDNVETVAESNRMGFYMVR